MIEKVRGAKKLRKKHREEETRGRSQKGEERERNKSLRSDGVQKKKEKKNKREEKMTGTDAKKKTVYEINTVVSLFHGKMLNVCKSTSRAFQEHQQFSNLQQNFS